MIRPLTRTVILACMMPHLIPAVALAQGDSAAAPQARSRAGCHLFVMLRPV